MDLNKTQITVTGLIFDENCMTQKNRLFERIVDTFQLILGIPFRGTEEAAAAAAACGALAKAPPTTT